MAPGLLLIISKGFCFISCECQISAIYILRLLHAGEWLLILPKINGSGRAGIKNKKTKKEEEKQHQKKSRSQMENIRYSTYLTWMCLKEFLAARLGVHVGRLCKQSSSIFQPWHQFIKQCLTQDIRDVPDCLMRLPCRQSLLNFEPTAAIQSQAAAECVPSLHHLDAP